MDNSRSYVLPFIEKTKELHKGVNVMEIGCGEGGVLLPFAENGCYCVGVDLNPLRIDLANDFLIGNFITRNITRGKGGLPDDFGVEDWVRAMKRPKLSRQ